MITFELSYAERSLLLTALNLYSRSDRLLPVEASDLAALQQRLAATRCSAAGCEYCDAQAARDADDSRATWED